MIPNSFVQFMNSMLINAVPRSCTIDWGISKECIHFSTAEIVARPPVFETGNTIKKREKASITKKSNEGCGYLVGEKVPCDQSGLFRTEPSCSAILPVVFFLCFGFGFLFRQFKQSAVSAHIQSNKAGQ